MKTLVILAHPNLENSRVNQRWKEELLLYPNDITLHEIYKEYPDWNINVPREQNLMETYDHVIFQFPLYWYSYPPLLKKWFDDVLAYGWAYGSNGNKLNGKKLGLALSIGDKKENYQPAGSVSFTVDAVIAPFKASAKHVGAEALPYFAVFGASFQASDEEINTSAKEYIEYIFNHRI
ncbi:MULTISPECIES: NAD(P)H-dependent oxidoreductase [Paenibacillus]|jgi:putative NADPH-quinone reductase|uniref:NAD(P)H-dependent oxidoreductase n=1 Tax=Paenibacillus TaxID=44249 RepID=UPI00096C1EE3|nr:MULTISPECIES: NAD(P)H-dependent oxidoreductase [Paenibacillus]MDH6430731.1 putative NADPH-quinone reductase [Paenibacillus sp. PastH-4]MDH6446574.1 putative NADPH-quinone reductase [Paenibacillus sp. PastF-4]MDH6530968.1 putative NADPH-quinone reductase [Paenibacillus sp. PastH-3]OMD57589.1 NAD(P)H oxidoreductase [Paenibacillus odorifer]